MNFVFPIVMFVMFISGVITLVCWVLEQETNEPDTIFSLYVQSMTPSLKKLNQAFRDLTNSLPTVNQTMKDFARTFKTQPKDW
jgi:hypothetical protein